MGFPSPSVQEIFERNARTIANRQAEAYLKANAYINIENEFS